MEELSRKIIQAMEEILKKADQKEEEQKKAQAWAAVKASLKLKHILSKESNELTNYLEQEELFTAMDIVFWEDFLKKYGLSEERISDLGPPLMLGTIYGKLYGRLTKKGQG